MKNLLLILSTLFFVQMGIAQTAPANDACAGAIDLGSLPDDTGCNGANDGSASSSVTVNGTNVDATAENPYSTVAGCYTGGDMASPAADVWYTFTPTSNHVEIAISGLANPNVGLYSGVDCDNMQPEGCANGTGASTFTFEQINPGDTYWIQVSGGDINDQAAFSFDISNYTDCGDCIINSSMTITPMPVNGVYQPGQTVSMCYRIDGYVEQNTNWFHGIEPIFSAGWDATTMTVTQLPTTQMNTSGTWGYYPGGITQSVSPFNSAGAGFYFEDPAFGDPNDPGDNYGDGGGSVAQAAASSWEFCWDISTVLCSPGTNNLDLTVEVLNFGDGEIGAWTDVGCTDDPPYTLNAVLSCCDAPLVSSTNVTCFGACDGTGTVTGQGTAPYDYVWTNAADNSTVYTDNGNSGASNATGLCPGNYQVSVTDANDCEQIIIITITQPDQIVLSEVNTDISCFGVCDGTGTVTVDSGGTGAFTYDWAGAGNTPTAASNTGLCVGTHTVTVTDGNGCTETIDVVITEPAQIVLSEVNTDITCFGACDGTGTVSVNAGGTPTFTYDWGGAGNTPTASSNTGLCAATHTVTVTDGNGCTETIDVEITEPAQIVLSEVHTDMTCSGVCDGTGTVTVDAGGTGAFTYDWGGAGDTPTAASNTGLCAGTHTVTVTDANGCTETIDVVITEPAAIVATEINVDISCFGLCDGSVDATTSGGTGALTYSWDSGETTEDITGLCAGDYTLTVTDANGCTETVTATITEPADITVNVSGTGTSCGNCDGTAAVTYSGGTGALTVDWPTVPSTADNVTNLCAGSYDVTITDANGCTATETQSISDAGGPTITLDGSTNVSCFGVCDGTIDVTVTGGSAPLSYSWDNGETTEDISGLCAGDYCLTVTDNNGCTAIQCITITEPTDITATEIHTDVSCFGVCDGTIDATTAGGTGTLVYAWDNGQSTEDLTGLCAGTYTLTITDDNGCTETVAATITEPTELTLTIAGTDATAQGACDGSADATPVGGTAPLTYLWDNGETTEDITGLCAGTYCLTVTDANGCTVTECVVIDEPSDINITLVTTDETCFGACDGTATVTIDLPGVDPHTVTWTVTGGTIAADDMSVTGLCNQNVSVTVTDANGVTATANAVINEPAEIILSETHTDVTCFGACDGTGSVTIDAGGVAPFTYDWGGAGNAPTSDTNTGLCAGTHTVTVTDANGCIQTIDVIITEPTQLALSETHTDVTCFGACDGFINVTTTGGTTPYTYAWDNSEVSEDIINLCAGDYTLTATDDNGCVETITITITEPAEIIPTPTMTAANCGQDDGGVSVTVIGGTVAADYTYEWQDDQGNVVGTTATVNNLFPGNYCVTVTDDNGCTATACIDVDNITAGTIAVNVDGNVSCNGVCDGAATITTTGGTAPYTYNWMDSNGNVVFTENTANLTSTINTLCADDYDVQVIDAVGCIMTDNFTITEPAPLAIVLDNSTNVTCFGACDGTADLTTSGGTAPYTYAWDSGQTTEDLTGLCAGDYNLTVTDDNGCIVNITVTITEPTELTLATAAFEVTCFGGSDGQVIVIPSGGTVSNTYDFEWTNSSGTVVSTDPDANGLPAGTYTINVWDDNSCNATADVIVIEPTPITYSFTSTPSNCGQADGEACVTAAGGTEAGTYDFEWTNSSGTVVSSADCATGILAGDYTVSITDDNGCVITADTTIADLAGPSLAIDNITIPTCFGDCDGEISLVTSGGQSTNFVYGYSFNGGAPQVTPNPATGLCQGDYVFTAVDEFGCIATVATNMTEPTQVVVQAYSDTTICIGGCADLSASANGGTGAYSYDWGANGTNMAFTDCPTANTTYSVIAYDANGCASAPASVDVTINPPLTLDLATIGPDAVCPGESVTLDATYAGGSGNGYAITWDPTPDDGINPQDPPVVFTPGSSMTITATLTDGCETPDAVATLDITVFDIPIIDFEADQYEGCQPLIVNFTHNITPTPIGFAWDLGDGTASQSNSANPSYTYNTPGSYDISLIMTTPDGCIDSLTVTDMINVYENPVADFTFTPQGTTILEPEITFDGGTSYLADLYDWNFGDGNTGTGMTPVHSYGIDGSFETQLIVTTVNGCQDSITQTVVIDPDFAIFVPNAFKPGGDGPNNLFKPVGMGIDRDNYEFWIYDRWGNQIFHSVDYDQAWNGVVHECATCPPMDQRSEAQIDVYVWVLKTVDTSQNNKKVKMVGHVSIIR